jgi:hypothetical protein
MDDTFDGFDEFKLLEAVHPRNVARDCARFAIIARVVDMVLDSLGDIVEGDDIHFSVTGILSQLRFECDRISVLYKQHLNGEDHAAWDDETDQRFMKLYGDAVLTGMLHPGGEKL